MDFLQLAREHLHLYQQVAVAALALICSAAVLAVVATGCRFLLEAFDTQEPEGHDKEDDSDNDQDQDEDRNG